MEPRPLTGERGSPGIVSAGKAAGDEGVAASAELFSRGVVLARVLCGSPPA